MPIELLPSLLLTIIVVGFTPGPANLYALACCLKYGRRRALKMWRGLVVGFVFVASTLAILTHLLGEVLGDYVLYFRYFGAAYIFWLAWKIFRDSGRMDPEAEECSFRSGMIMQLLNAKMMLLDLTVFSVYVLPYSDRLIDLGIIVVLLLLAGPLANLCWLYAGAWLRRFFQQYRRRLDNVMAVLLAGCALYILFG